MNKISYHNDFLKSRTEWNIVKNKNDLETWYRKWVKWLPESIISKLIEIEWEKLQNNNNNLIS